MNKKRNERVIDVKLLERLRYYLSELRVRGVYKWKEGHPLYEKGLEGMDADLKKVERILAYGDDDMIYEFEAVKGGSVIYASEANGRIKELWFNCDGDKVAFPERLTYSGLVMIFGEPYKTITREE